MHRSLILATLALSVVACTKREPPKRVVTLPPNLLAEFKAAPTQGDVYTVTGEKQFAGKILKVDTIAFTSKSKLKMTGGYPYVAVIARRVLVGAPDEEFSIIASPGKAPYGQAPKPPHPGKAADGPDNGAHGGNGAPGVNGRYGVDGSRGSNGRAGPALYILANEVLRQDGTVPPTFADVFIDTQGQDGQAGQPAQDGQHGGNGGSGGASVWDANPFTGGCKIGAGSGGSGGNGGAGGTGGSGGNGGRGGDIYYGGSEVVRNMFSFAKTNVSGGAGAHAAGHGLDGNIGRGGPRGAWNGNCHGGSPGPHGVQMHKSHTNRPGEDATGGLIYYAPLDVTTLLP